MASERADDSRPWFDAAFERGYLELYPHRDLAAARAEVAGLVARGLGDARGPVLDLGCGYGRHLFALREHGLRAFGLDRSRALLRAADARLRPYLTRGDFRALPLRDGSFGAVVMMFSSFGYFDDEENARTLQEVARVCRAGGWVILDGMNPARVRIGLVPESHTRRGQLELHERRSLSSDGRRVIKEVLARASDGSERRWREDVRLYEPAELAALLERAGLAKARVEGDFDGRAWTADAPRAIVWARRSG